MRKLILLLLLLPSLAFGQTANRAKGMLAAERDTTRLFQGVSVGVDLLGAAQTALGSQGHYEAGVRVNLKDKYFPAFEVGYGKADKHDEYTAENSFKTSAPYYRVGCDFNILKNKHDVYRLYVGVRYGFSSFKYDTSVLTPLTDDDGQILVDKDNRPITSLDTFTGEEASAHWLEGVFGIDVPLWSHLHLGWDIRYKRRITQSYGEGGKPWYVPGLGNNNNAQLWGRFLLSWEF